MKQLAIIMGLLLIGVVFLNVNPSNNVNNNYHSEEEDYGDMIGQEALKSM